VNKTPAIATINKCVDIEIFRARNKVETAIPKIPPVLHKPCKEPIMVRFIFFCRAIAWVLTEILKMRMLKAKIQMAATNKIGVSAYPIIISEAEFNPQAIARGTRLSNRETSHPEIGRPTRELIGIASNRVPSSASFKSKNNLMVGILEAQVEKLNPEIKKKILKKSLCLFRTVI
jgi:hypothetical protein